MWPQDQVAVGNLFPCPEPKGFNLQSVIGGVSHHLRLNQCLFRDTRNSVAGQFRPLTLPRPEPIEIVRTTADRPSRYRVPDFAITS